jgi:hypothetical protein
MWLSFHLLVMFLEWTDQQKAAQGQYCIDESRLRVLQATPSLFNNVHSQYYTSEDFMRTSSDASTAATSTMSLSHSVVATTPNYLTSSMSNAYINNARAPASSSPAAVSSVLASSSGSSVVPFPFQRASTFRRSFGHVKLDPIDHAYYCM